MINWRIFYPISSRLFVSVMVMKADWPPCATHQLRHSHHSTRPKPTSHQRSICHWMFPMQPEKFPLRRFLQLNCHQRLQPPRGRQHQQHCQNHSMCRMMMMLSKWSTSRWRLMTMSVSSNFRATSARERSSQWLSNIATKRKRMVTSTTSTRRRRMQRIHRRWSNGSVRLLLQRKRVQRNAIGSKRIWWRFSSNTTIRIFWDCRQCLMSWSVCIVWRKSPAKSVAKIAQFEPFIRRWAVRRQEHQVFSRFNNYFCFPWFSSRSRSRKISCIFL